jgi:hypothetical protein
LWRGAHHARLDDIVHLFPPALIHHPQGRIVLQGVIDRNGGVTQFPPGIRIVFARQHEDFRLRRRHGYRDRDKSVAPGDLAADNIGSGIQVLVDLLALIIHDGHLLAVAGDANPASRAQKRGVRFRVDIIQRADLFQIEGALPDNQRLVLNVAFNYGGRDEIVYAIQQMLADGVKAEEVDAELVSRYLFTAGQPDPDLIIRTAGELRISNFLLWQGAYAEYFAADVYWPDFDKEEFRRALAQFGQRERRYGHVRHRIYDLIGGAPHLERHR